MTDRFRLTIAQLNATVGNLAGNAARARAAWDEAKAAGAQMLALPEMFLTGYQTQDLVLKPAFTRQAEQEIAALAARCAGGPAIGIGGISQVVDHLEPGARLGGAVRARDAQLDARGLPCHRVQQVEVAAPVLVLRVGEDVIQLHHPFRILWWLMPLTRAAISSGSATIR